MSGMKLGEMFVKPIDRRINGVIKVAQQDAENVFQELEEYVVTPELEKHFATFFRGFSTGLQTPNDEIGVWIAGFFGSGKSHLLKIFSYLLENRAANGRQAVEFFDLSKFDDPLLLAEIKRAALAKSDVMLFNIDSQADASAKSDKDSIVKVFQKVFDTQQGYLGENRGVAHFERQLERRGLYSAFKTAFAEIHNEPWEAARDGWSFLEAEIAAALEAGAGMTRDAAVSAASRIGDAPELSVQGFAQTVKAHLDARGSGHRVVFMVDEVGQYIGDDPHLMLNLQTVVEDLGSVCGGRAWVVVTSQEAMDKITRDIKNTDFSKIQGRFHRHRISLSSVNTDEVIKRRLLEKTPTAVAALEALYAAESVALRNQLSFVDTAEMPIYTSAEDFVAAYPFVPYQFTLLQKVFTQIRLMGAAGKHLAEGERSLLDAFQIASRSLASSGLGVLAPFHAFYAAIESFVDGSISRVIQQAKTNAGLEPQDVDLLKTLFLIKYVKEVPGNLENLTTLALTSVNEDKAALRSRIEASLVRLERQFMVQRSGERFEFLTNEEQDVGREINGTTFDAAEVTEVFQRLMWEGVIRDKQFKLEDRPPYNLNRKLDDAPYGRAVGDIGLHVITPYSTRYGDLTTQAALLESGNGLEVILRLRDHETLIAEATEYVKTSKYVARKNQSTLSAATQTILRGRAEENTRRETRVQQLLEAGIKTADVFVCGQLLTLGSRDVRSVTQEALRELVQNAYSKYDYVRSRFKDDAQVVAVLQGTAAAQPALEGVLANAAAHADLSAHLQDAMRRQQRVTLREIVVRYTAKPFGWSETDALGVAAELVASGQLELRHQQQVVSPSDKKLIAALKTKSAQDEYQLRLTEEIDPAALRATRELAQDFGIAQPPSDAPKLHAALRAALETTVTDLNAWARSALEGRYPFQTELAAALKLLGGLLTYTSPNEFMTAVQRDLTALQNSVDQIGRYGAFFKTQHKLFDATRAALNALEPELRHVTDAALLRLAEDAKTVLSLPDPISRIPSLSGLLQPLQTHVQTMLETQRAAFAAEVTAAQQRLRALAAGVDEAEQKITGLETLRAELLSARTMDAAIARHAELGRLEARLSAEIEAALEAHSLALLARTFAMGAGDTPAQPAPKPVQHVRPRELSSVYIETTDQLEAFLSSLRGQLETGLRDGKRIKIE